MLEKLDFSWKAANRQLFQALLCIYITYLSLFQTNVLAFIALGQLVWCIAPCGWGT